MSAKVSLLVIFTLLFAGCAHSVRVITVPAGGTVKVDGKVIGKAPLIYEERSGSPFRSSRFTVEVPGFPAKTQVEDVKVCPTKGNLLMNAFAFGLFFGFCLRDEYVFDLTEEKRPSDPKIPRS